MVPVPDEVLDQVRAYLLFNVGGARTEPQLDPVHDVIEAHPDLHRLVRFVADAVLEGEPITLRGLATALDTGVREVTGTIQEINLRVREAGGPAAVLLLQPDPSTMPDDSDPFEHRVVRLGRQLAQAVVRGRESTPAVTTPAG